jgi:uncharacterized protein HemY
MPSRIESIKEMIAQDPEDAFLRFSLGMEHAGAENWSAAAEAFGQCLEVDPDYLAAYVERGKALRETGDLSGAREAFAEAMEVAAAQDETHVQNYIRQQLNSLPRPE